jgi:hypothetical protein
MRLVTSKNNRPSSKICDAEFAVHDLITPRAYIAKHATPRIRPRRLDFVNLAQIASRQSVCPKALSRGRSLRRADLEPRGEQGDWHARFAD